MTRRVLFNEAEFGKSEDLTDIGRFAQAAMDNLVADAIGYPAHWSGFTASQQSSQIVRLTPGRYYTGEMVYEALDETDINLLVSIPLASSDQRWVAIILRGSVEEEMALRYLETSTDVETSEPVQFTVPKVAARKVGFTRQLGEASPAPAARPVIAESDAVVAWVLLGSAGILAIEPGEPSRVKSLYEVEGRVSDLEDDVTGISTRTTAIETDIVNIAARLRDIPRPAIMRQIQRNLGQLNREIVLPEEARAHVFDSFLTWDIWDPTHAAWRGRVREGGRVPYTSESISQLTLATADDPAVMIRNGRMIPAFDEIVRIANEGHDAALNISQLTHTVVTATRHEVARSRVAWGTAQLVCTNTQYWANQLAGVQIGQMFTLDGETFLLEGSNGLVHYSGQDMYRHIRRAIVEEWSEVWWTYENTEVGLNGSVYAQSFLNAQPFIATAIELDFEKVGATGDVTVMLCTCSAIGAPDFGQVIAHVTKARDALVVGWNEFVIDYTLLEAGKRYAIVTVTTGNHSIWCTGANKFTGGTRFACTDGVFQQGDLSADFAFRVRGARMRQPRTEIAFDPVALAGGMTDVEMVMKSWAPGGTALEWQFRPSGQPNWYPIEDDYPGGGHPLASLPALIELKLVMLGTADLAPMVVVDNKLKCRVGRNSDEAVLVSKVVNFGLSATQIVTQYLLDAFDDTIHDFTPQVIVGATTYPATATTVSIDVDDPKRRFVESTFTVPPTTSARMAPKIETDNVVDVPFVNNAMIIAT
ncbi:hypothetical protein [Bosea sp. MMO-172]|uniref:hypothetical protein n=1 Tax=Bosea sp. MMO-172 TaxID=3127885 RepID=UPI003015B12F